MAKLTKANLESLLADWHGWCNSVNSVIGLGYGKVNHIAKMASTSRARQIDDDAIEDWDHRASEAEMKLADRIIKTMNPQLRMAISVRARNLWSGVEVWSNPRLPKGADLARITEESYSVFTRRWEVESA